jgi:hypothetical protein
MDDDLLSVEVIKVRKVLSEHHHQISKNYLKNFPRGCCANASLLLANWLERKGIKGIKGIKVIFARNEKSASHSWLVVNEQIVDITSDQFKGQRFGIFPINSSYHASFCYQSEDVPHIPQAMNDPLDEFIKLIEKK